MIDLSKITRHKEMTEICIPSYLWDSWNNMLKLNKITDYRFIPKEHFTKKQKRVTPIKPDPLNKPLILLSHFDPNELITAFKNIRNDPDIKRINGERIKNAEKHEKEYFMLDTIYGNFS